MSGPIGGALDPAALVRSVRRAGLSDDPSPAVRAALGALGTNHTAAEFADLTRALESAAVGQNGTAMPRTARKSGTTRTADSGPAESKRIAPVSRQTVAAVATLPADEAAALGCLIFRLPLPERLNNGSVMTGHWRARHHERGRWMDRADATPGHPPVPRLPILHARLAAVLVLGGAMDEDNAMSRLKVSLDWLVRRRYLRTDRKRLAGQPALVWEGFPHQDVRRDPARHCLVLHLTPLAP